MNSYLLWNEQTITDFSPENITALYNKGYVFTRKGRGVIQQTRSVRIDLSLFELSSENRRILRKIEGLNLNICPIPYSDYTWPIGKMAKDFYETKFGQGTMSANKVKEMMTDAEKSNFNTLFSYRLTANSNQPSAHTGYAICYANNEIVHYSYPFYSLSAVSCQPLANLGMGMMTMAVVAAKENEKKYVYLGSAQRPGDTYKLQFQSIEWFDGKEWQTDQQKIKEILNSRRVSRDRQKSEIRN